MARNEEIVQKINNFLAEEFEVDSDRIVPGANLKETLDLDSLDYIDLVVVIESNFSFKVKPGDKRYRKEKHVKNIESTIKLLQAHPGP